MDFHRTRQGRNRKRDLYTDSDVSNPMALMLPSVHFPCNFVFTVFPCFLPFSHLLCFFSSFPHISLSPLSVFFFSFVSFVSIFLPFLFISLALSPSVPLTHFCNNARMLRNNDNAYQLLRNIYALPQCPWLLCYQLGH